MMDYPETSGNLPETSVAGFRQVSGFWKKNHTNKKIGNLPRRFTTGFRQVFGGFRIIHHWRTTRYKAISKTIFFLWFIILSLYPPNFMYGCIGIKKNNSVASSKIWMNVCLQWWWAEHGGIKLVPFVIHNLWVDPAAASCLSRWYPKLIMVHEKRWIELRFFFLQCS